jgi:hypothetical protein
MRTALSGLALAVGTVLSFPALGAELPPIKATNQNKAVGCATPGRLMAFLQSRNPRLDARFDTIATEYMRHGEDLAVRWDTAFFQMLVETGNLTFTGDVKPAQNNFAGLGATGKGAPGESFDSVAKGVRAHLEHVLMYAGERIDSPVADRTRKVQEWGVLTSWQKTIKGSVTFTHLARKWAPGDKGYASDIAAIAQKFAETSCKEADPRPELVAEARKGLAVAVDMARAIDPQKSAAGEASGIDSAKRSVAAAVAAGDTKRLALGAGSALAEAGKSATTAAAPATGNPPAYKILNAPKDEPPANGDAATASAAPDTGRTETAALAAGSGAARSAAKAAPSKSACKVWTASYGGQKAVIIKAVAGETTNYTVLDVNEGREKREAEAYIAAYAKGGETVAEFKTQNLALDKAFNLCPEG